MTTVEAEIIVGSDELEPAIVALVDEHGGAVAVLSVPLLAELARRIASSAEDG